jgi:hypothetical protein
MGDAAPFLQSAARTCFLQFSDFPEARFIGLALSTRFTNPLTNQE